MSEVWEAIFLCDDQCFQLESFKLSGKSKPMLTSFEQFQAVLAPESFLSESRIP